MVLRDHEMIYAFWSTIHTVYCSQNQGEQKRGEWNDEQPFNVNITYKRAFISYRYCCFCFSHWTGVRVRIVKAWIVFISSSKAALTIRCLWSGAFPSNSGLTMIQSNLAPHPSDTSTTSWCNIMGIERLYTEVRHTYQMSCFEGFLKFRGHVSSWVSTHFGNGLECYWFKDSGQSGKEGQHVTEKTNFWTFDYVSPDGVTEFEWKTFYAQVTG